MSWWLISVLVFSLVKHLSISTNMYLFTSTFAEKSQEERKEEIEVIVSFYRWQFEICDTKTNTKEAAFSTNKDRSEQYNSSKKSRHNRMLRRNGGSCSSRWRNWERLLLGYFVVEYQLLLLLIFLWYTMNLLTGGVYGVVRGGNRYWTSGQ